MMTDKEKNEIDCVQARVYGNENLEKITIYMEEIKTILNLIEKQEERINDVSDRLEYYLIGNFSLNDYQIRDKELTKLLKLLKE